ncbi:MAG: Sec-independent protein translocase protein TatA [Acidimicrobiales bacterium]|nr:Sec-independent protein translocase protein TatA [Acidimicrobiales bacterium]
MLAFLEGPDLIIVLVVVVLLFGSSQLPKFARSLGQAKKEFESGIREGEGKDTVAETAAPTVAEQPQAIPPASASPAPSPAAQPHVAQPSPAEQDQPHPPSV